MASTSIVIEPQRELPVCGAYDVVVAGGGIAGVAAAVAAARAGASVCLLERTFALGGLATIGNVIVWLALCDGKGRQVIAGLGEELLKLSVADLDDDYAPAHFCRYPACWEPGGDLEERKQHRYIARFNPASYLLALEQATVEAGVKLLYDTRVCAVNTADGAIRHVIVENKSGRSAIACGTVVDASGDADVCHLAGEETESLDSNVLAGWFYTFSEGELRLRHLTNRYSMTGNRAEAVGPFFRGDDGDEVTGQLLGSRQMIRDRLAKLQSENPGKAVHLVNPPTYPGHRMTRRLIGKSTLTNDHMHQWFHDAIGLSGDGNDHIRGPVYAIPLSSLCAQRNANLLTAGRCVSCHTSVWDLMRLIPACAVTGQGAGVAAAIAARDHHGNLPVAPIADIQSELRRQNVLLDPALVEPA